MNKRIRELAEQAWDDTREKFGSFVDDGGEIDFTFLHAYDQKFAELIVKECLDQCYFNGMNDELYAGQLKAAAYIEKHFGVENERSTT